MSSDFDPHSRARPPARERAQQKQPKESSEPRKQSKQTRGQGKQDGARTSRRRKDAHETSAGGVVIRGERGREQVVVIVPIRRSPKGGRVLGLPKGHIDPGETALQAATREVREETGVVAERIHDLGEVRYWYRRDRRAIDKSVAFFLFRYLSGETDDHDDEVEQARWIDLREALAELSYEGERSMIARAMDYLDKER